MDNLFDNFFSNEIKNGYAYLFKWFKGGKDRIGHRYKYANTAKELFTEIIVAAIFIATIAFIILEWK